MKGISKAGSFFVLKKLNFGLDKKNFNNKIVSFIHLGGIKKVCD